MTRVYCAFVMGQGGRLTSGGVAQMCAAAQAAGVTSELFEYGDYERVGSRIDDHRSSGFKIAGVGYSLGVSTLTYLQEKYDFDLLLCVAASTYAQNYRIRKLGTKRAVLWRGPGPLSEAGGDLGFDVVRDVEDTHLHMDMNEAVQSGVMTELRELL